MEQRHAQFPAFTVCPEGGGYKEYILKVVGDLAVSIIDMTFHVFLEQAHGLTNGIKDYNVDGPNLSWGSNQTGTDEKQLFDMVIYN